MNQEPLSEDLKAQFATEFISIMTTALNSKCFSQCIKKPGVKLERADEACLSRCMDTYLESWNTVSHTVNRIQQKILEQAQAHKSELLE